MKSSSPQPPWSQGGWRPSVVCAWSEVHRRTDQGSLHFAKGIYLSTLPSSPSFENTFFDDINTSNTTQFSTSPTQRAMDMISFIYTFFWWHHDIMISWYWYQYQQHLNHHKHFKSPPQRAMDVMKGEVVRVLQLADSSVVPVFMSCRFLMIFIDIVLMVIMSKDKYLGSVDCASKDLQRLPRWHIPWYCQCWACDGTWLWKISCEWFATCWLESWWICWSWFR